MPTDLFTGETDEDEGFSLDRMAQNIAPSTKKLIEDTIYPITHPVQTVKGLNAMGSGLGQMLAKSGGPFGVGKVEGVTRETMPNPENVDAVQAVGQFYKDRYGGTDEILNTLETDPAGAAADLAGLLSGSAYTAAKVGGKGSKLAKVLKAGASAADPLNIPTHAVKALPTRSLYRAGMKTRIDPKTGMTRQKARDIGNQAYDLDIRPNDDGARKLMAERELRGQAIDQSVSGMKGDIPVDSMYKYAPEARARMQGTGRGSRSDQYLNQFDDTIEEYMNRATAQGDTFTPQQMQDAKVGRYQEATPAAYGQNPKNPASQQANKIMGRGAKEALEFRNPELTGLNTRYADVDRISDAVPWNEGSGFGTDYTARVIAGSSGAPQQVSGALGVASNYLRNKAMTTALLLKKLADNPSDNALARALSRQTGLTVQEIQESKPEDLFETLGLSQVGEN